MTSLLKVSDQMFTHLALVLKDRRAAAPAPVPPPSGVGGTPATTPTVAEQAISLVSSLRKDRTAAPPPPPPVSAEKPDVLEQLSKLAALRDAGVVTEDEFAAKKAELLSRM